MRVAELGAGLMLRKTQVTAQTIRDLSKRLLSDPKYKQESARIGETMREAGGVARAADEIETLLSRRKIA
jgi:UDP:flavonoid glycosyltransferase YjiC (YdhE family)